MFAEVKNHQIDDNTLHLSRSDQLWKGIRRGDKQALSELFKTYYSQLYNYGFKIVPKEELVKDSIQELFLVLWSKRKKINKAYAVKSYLFHSIRRIILRSLRRQRSRIKRDKVYVSDYFEETFNIEELIIHFEIKKKQKSLLVEAVESLSSRQKEAIFLKYYQGLSNSEIAYVMEINRQSVYNHISKAINQLKGFVDVS